VASLAAVACGVLVQDAAAGEETARLNPRVAGLLARHVHPDAVHKAVSISHLAEPPGLWFMVAMAVMFLNVKRRGGSTVRIATAAGASLAIAAALNAVLAGWDRHQQVSLGAAAVAALGITTTLFARRWLEPRRAAIAVVAIGAAAAGFGMALAIAGQPFTALAAGACLGVAVTGVVEAAARLRWGRWLADHPRLPPPAVPEGRRTKPERSIQDARRSASVVGRAGR
jgi:MFS family permease